MEKEFHVSYLIIFYKFLLGLVEFATGIGIAIFGSGLYQFYRTTVRKELTEDPHDLLARISNSIVPNLLTHNTYILIYLIILGLAKMLGSVGLIYKQNWGVDLLVVLTVLMAPFQIYDLFIHPNIFDFIYFSLGLLIAFYLIEFRPRAWVSRVLKMIQ